MCQIAINNFKIIFSVWAIVLKKRVKSKTVILINIGIRPYMKIYLIWLVGVIIWNYGVPQATPLEDVLVAIALSFLTIGLKKYLKI